MQQNRKKEKQKGERERGGGTENYIKKERERERKKNSMKFNKKRTNLIASKADDGNTQKQEIYTQQIKQIKRGGKRIKQKEEREIYKILGKRWQKERGTKEKRKEI